DALGPAGEDNLRLRSGPALPLHVVCRATHRVTEEVFINAAPESSLHSWTNPYHSHSPNYHSSSHLAPPHRRLTCAVLRMTSSLPPFAQFTCRPQKARPVSGTMCKESRN